MKLPSLSILSLALVGTVLLSNSTAGLEAYQNYDGPLSGSIVSRSIQNYSFVARSLYSLNNNNNARVALVQTGWVRIPGDRDLISFQMSLTLRQSSSTPQTLPDNCGFWWALKGGSVVNEKWEYGLITRSVDTSKSSKPQTISLEEGISTGGFENKQYGNKISQAVDSEYPQK